MHIDIIEKRYYNAPIRYRLSISIFDIFLLVKKLGTAGWGGNKMVRVEHLEKQFKKKQVLKGIDFSFEEKVYGLLGPNGAGKTTLMRCMTNLYDCSAGAVTYDGVPIAKSKVYFREMGYLPQKFGVFHDLTVQDIMRYFAYEKGMKKAIWNRRLRKA